MLAISRNLVEGIHRARGLRGPHALEFLVLEEHAEFAGLLIVVDDRQRVALLEIVADEHIVLRPGLPYLTLYEIREHLTRGHLIIAGRIRLQLLDGEGIADDMGMVDHRVSYIDIDEVAHQLLAVVPHDGIMVKRHARVFRVIDE